MYIVRILCIALLLISHTISGMLNNHRRVSVLIANEGIRPIWCAKGLSEDALLAAIIQNKATGALYRVEKNRTPYLELIHILEPVPNTTIISCFF